LGELSEVESGMLRALDKALQQMSGPEHSDLWTLAALEERTEWNEIRRLAKDALREMESQQGWNGDGDMTD
jgi:hypothetical protein